MGLTLAFYPTKKYGHLKPRSFFTDAWQTALFGLAQIDVSTPPSDGRPNEANNMCTLAIQCFDHPSIQTELFANCPRGHVPFTLGNVPSWAICDC